MPFPSQCMPHAGSVHLCRMSTFIVFLLRSSEMHCTCTFKIHQNSTNPCIVRVCVLHLSFRACKCTCCKVFQQSLDCILRCCKRHIWQPSFLKLWWSVMDAKKIKEVDCRRSNDFPLKRLEETGRKQHPKVDKNCLGILPYSFECNVSAPSSKAPISCYAIACWVLFPTRIWKLLLHRFQFLLPKRWSTMGEGRTSTRVRVRMSHIF